jgi:hypothetical protein
MKTKIPSPSEHRTTTTGKRTWGIFYVPICLMSTSFVPSDLEIGVAKLEKDFPLPRSRRVPI